jgi:hypothetical protein
MTVRIFFLASLLAGGLMLGCGSDDGSGSGDATATTAGGTTGDSPDGSYEWTATLLVSDWVSQGPLEGVELCWDDETVGCKTTDAEGLATITATVTPGNVMTLRADAEGYFPFTVVSEIPATAPAATTDPSTWAMAADSIIESLVSALGAPTDDAKGHATVLIFGPADAEGTRVTVEGATASLSAAAEQGPKYFNPTAEFGNGIFSEGDTTTSAGFAAFFNVDVGEAEVTVDVPGHTCSVGIAGVAGSGDNKVKSPIEAGRVSYYIFVCDAD